MAPRGSSWRTNDELCHPPPVATIPVLHGVQAVTIYLIRFSYYCHDCPEVGGPYAVRGDSLEHAASRLKSALEQEAARPGSYWSSCLGFSDFAPSRALDYPAEYERDELDDLLDAT